jgi:transcriptional regulator with XRE-family HTH domain/tetratricopeptide (TPR) repeat protein
MDTAPPESPQPPTFGELLRRFRLAAGVSQERLAERAGLSVQALSALENGRRQAPYRHTVTLLAQGLDLSAAETALLEASITRGRLPARAAISASLPIAQAPSADRLPAQDGGAEPSRRVTQGPALSPLVGHGRELALLGGHLAGEGPPLLLLAGEPGIGKSRLLAEVAGHAHDQGWTVLQGGCQRRGGQEPYAPLLEALEHHIQRQSDGRRRDVLQGCAWLVRLLPELAAEPIEPLPTWTVPPEQEHRLLFKAFLRYLANVAGPAGTLLALDDLQWAGADALDLLATLVRAATDVPLRVVGAYRDTEAAPGSPLSVTLADLAHAGLAREHLLGPLTPAEVGQFLDHLLAGSTADQQAVRERLVQRTGGVPFFVVSCVQALRQTEHAGDTQEAVPRTVAQSVRQRLANLSSPAQEVLGVAAVLGRVMQPTLLATVVAQPEDVVLSALEAAQRLRLLEASEGTYRFAHDLVREVVEGEVGPARRLVLHRRVAEALEHDEGEPPVVVLAFHYARSDAQEKAVIYLERAGDQAAAQFAPATAEAYYQELVERLEGLGRLSAVPRIREKLGMVLSVQARYDAALVAVEPAADSYQASQDLEGLGLITAQIGLIHSARGTHEEGLARVLPLVARLGGDAPSRGLALLYLALADLLGKINQLSEGIAAADRASNLARALGDRHLLASAEMTRGNRLARHTRAKEARAVLESAVPLAEAAGDLNCLNRLFNLLAHQHLHLADFPTSQQYIDRALALAERTGDVFNIAFELMHRGIISFCGGSWRQARADAERAASLCREIGTFYVSGYPHMVLGFICFGEGGWTAATEHLEQAVRLADASAPEALVMASSFLAEIDLLEGRPHAAQTRALALLNRFGPEIADNAYLLPKLAWAHLELGEMRQAEEAAAQAVAFAQTVGDFLNLVEALRVQALVQMTQQRWAEAGAILAHILAETQSRSYAWGEARVLDVYGLLHIRQGESEPARERLQAALTIYRRLGAQRDVVRLERDLAGLAGG